MSSKAKFIPKESVHQANIAVIGAGWWSQGWHLPHLERNPHAKISAIVDTSKHPKSPLNPNLEPLESLSIKYSVPIFSSMQEFLEDAHVSPTIDGVIIATPHSTHYDIAELLLREDERRKRQSSTKGGDTYRPLHLFVEKPMTTDVHQARKLFDRITKREENKDDDRSGCFLINHTANYRPQAKKAREIVKSGQIGTIRHINASMSSPLSWLFDNPSNQGWTEPTSKEMIGNGFCWGQSSHLIAWIYHVCPTLNPQKVFCAMNYSPVTGADVSHSATIMCSDSTFSEQDGGNDDVIMSISGTSLLPGYEHSDPGVGKRISIAIYGTKGAILYSGDDKDEKSGRLEFRDFDTGGKVCFPCGPGLGFHFENTELDGIGPESLQSFIDACLANDGCYIGSSASDGFRTIQTMEAMYRSNASHANEEVVYKNYYKNREINLYDPNPEQDRKVPPKKKRKTRTAAELAVKTDETVTDREEEEAEDSKETDSEEEEKEDTEKEKTIVWEVCCFPHGQRTLLLLEKEKYLYWRKHLDLLLCRTWKDVKELDIFDEVLDMYRNNIDRDDFDYEDEEKCRLRRLWPRVPKDDDEFTISMVEGWVYWEREENVEDDYEVIWPPCPMKILSDYGEEWMQKYNTFHSQFSWNQGLVTYNPDRKNDILEEISNNGWEAEHEPGLADLMIHYIRFDGLGEATLTEFIRNVLSHRDRITP